jgi:hypothetical protein
MCIASTRWIVVLVALAGCSDAPSAPSPGRLVGVWGADHINLVVDEAKSHLEFDCAHGDVPTPLTVDAAGDLAAPGTFVREHGGPIRVDEIADSHPALYSGSLTANTLRLTVRLTDNNELIGTFTLTRGVTGRVLKCL